MNGPKVLDFTMEAVPKYVCDLLHRSSLSVEDIDLFIFHQASKVVLDRVARKLSLGEEKIFRNYREDMSRRYYIIGRCIFFYGSFNSVSSVMC